MPVGSMLLRAQRGSNVRNSLSALNEGAHGLSLFAIFEGC